MISLDDLPSIIKLQKGDAVLKSIKALPNQLRTGWNQALKIPFPDDYREIDSIVLSGMGGSRFPGLIIKELFEEELEKPFIIKSGYRLPGFVSEKTLFILSSYSGTTEEVILTGKAAIKKKAKITAITSGGQVSLILKKIKAPFYLFHPIYNPSKQPRIGFGYTVGGLMGLLFNLGLIKLEKLEKTNIDTALKKLPSLINPFSIENPTPKNPAKQIAKKIYQKYPYYIVAQFLAGIGNAIANQTNETAKSISDFRIIPELNHHLMEGLKFPDDLKKLGIFIFFYSDLYHPRIKKRFYITKEVVNQNKIETVWHQLKGKTKIEQAFELMGFGSYLSMYLSILYQQDPSIIPYVDYFKKRLKE